MHSAVRDRVDSFREKIETGDVPPLYYSTVTSSPTAHLELQGREMDEPEEFLNFATSNYHGLGQRPEIRTAVKEILDQYGLGTNGSPVLNGYYDVHRDLERELAAFLEVEDAVLFSSGLTANEGAIGALIDSNDVCLLDRSCHGSLFLGAQIGDAQIRYYRHQDFDELEWLLDRFSGRCRALWLGLCGVFSMTGEIERMPRILELAAKYNVTLVLDDAHAFGVLGEHGRGTMEYYGLPAGAVDIHVGTLSKTLAGGGGFVAGDRELISYLRFNAKPHVLSAGVPPPVAGGCLAGICILRENGRAMTRELRRKADLFRSELNARLAGDSAHVLGTETPIIPVQLEDESDIFPVFERIVQRGIFLNPVVYPGVPKGEGVLRLAVTTTHEDEELEWAAAEICDCILEQTAVTAHAD